MPSNAPQNLRLVKSTDETDNALHEEVLATVARFRRCIDRAFDVAARDAQASAPRGELSRRFGLMPGLLSDKNEDFLIRHGNVAILAGFRKKRRGFYFQYVREFSSELRSLQSERVRCATVSIFVIVGTDIRLARCIAGMWYAGFLHLLRVKTAPKIAGQNLRRGIMLTYPMSTDCEYA